MKPHQIGWVPTLKFLKIDPTRLSGGIRLRVVPYTPFTAYQGAETLYIYMIWICEALQVWFEGLNHDVTTLDRLGPHPKFPEN
jgi:hypothetical protein